MLKSCRDRPGICVQSDTIENTSQLEVELDDHLLILQARFQLAICNLSRIIEFAL